ncbi:Frag1/DRAM/Sfk1 [Xylogone sp. PMI_703]|nr:Frag1/DRAM/Sfk1 [Xylogone sp. PMI_703]
MQSDFWSARLPKGSEHSLVTSIRSSISITRKWWPSLWILPLISAIAWSTMLGVMLVSWIQLGKPHIGGMQHYQRIAFVSDVGSLEDMKPIFVVGSSVMAAFFSCTVWAEWHQRRDIIAQLEARVPNLITTKSSMTGPLAGSIGCFGAILVAIFDVATHFEVHFICLLFANLAYLANAWLMCRELSGYLSIHNTGLYGSASSGSSTIIIRSRKGKSLEVAALTISMSTSLWTKTIVMSTEVVLCVICAACIKDYADAAAILEWSMVFLFTLYILSFAVDIYVLPTPKKIKLNLDYISIRKKQ